MEAITEAPANAAQVRRSAERGLDALNLLVANVQTGFGPFIANYLTSAAWTQTSIGIALSVGTATSMISQLPAGALVDSMRNKTRVAAFSILAFAASAIMLAVHPIPLMVYLAEVLHGFSSCTLGPAIAAMTIGLAGTAALGERFGRNTRFASIGNGVGAALMGACDSLISPRAVFVLTAVVTLPTLAALVPLRRHGRLAPAPLPQGHLRPGELIHALGNGRLLLFCLCAMLFTFANSPMLPLVSSGLTMHAGHRAGWLIAACIVLPQLLVALLAPHFGHWAQVHGRRAILAVGFISVPLRGVLFSSVSDPAALVAVQALDGVGAASFGVMLPLVVSDVAGRSGHFNLCLGLAGFAVGIGGTFSTTAAGWIADHAGLPAAFSALSGIGVLAVLLVTFVMPETRPAQRGYGGELGHGAAQQG